tara:strand:- start:1408 stop:1749 length:342 start_codon:yes stop_codon:yes gene_type:complete
MKTFENLQAEVVKLGEQSKETSAKIDLKESYSGIETFDADLVIGRLNILATYHENLSVKYKRYSKDNLNNGANYWADLADGHYHAGKEVRNSISYLIRTQKVTNQIINSQKRQ